MKKATLTKEGKYWKLNAPNYDALLPIYGDFGLKEDMLGKEVEFDNSGGSVKLIRFEGTDYTKKQTPPTNTSNRHNSGRNSGSGHRRGRDQHRGQRGNRNHSQASRRAARAPYNFVPLEKNIVPGNGHTDHSCYEGLSGYIDLEITAATDLFIRGRMEKFFAVNNKMAIPGSSLRGLIRNLVEIVSRSKMEFIDRDRRYFIRNIKENFYKDRFLETEWQNGDLYVSQKSKAAWLTREGNRFYLQRAPGFYKVGIRQLERINLNREDVLYHHEDIWFDPDSIQTHHRKIAGRTTLQLEYNIARRVSNQPRGNWPKGRLLITGLLGTAKHFQWIIPEALPNVQRVDVTDVMQEYNTDESRDEGADLINALKTANNGPIPCFYLEDDNGSPTAIGHTGIFRLPYKYKVGHAAKQEEDVNLDFAKSIFGFTDNEKKNGNAFAGKVYFEDAIAKNITGTEFAALRILSSPKPTSFQLYLAQTPGNHDYKLQDGERLHNWETDYHRIRGFKMYWHKNENAPWRNPEVVATANNKKELIQRVLIEKREQFTIAEVVKKDSLFKGKIRFDNLSDEELGALLFALDLPKGCGHKIGMGKPLGLGSIVIKPSLTLIDRNSRYQQLFSNGNNWESGAQNAKPDSFKDIFARYLGSKVEKSSINNTETYWSIDERMRELKYLLSLQPIRDSASWMDRTRYMEIEHGDNNNNEYSGRPILPKPSQVVKGDTYT